MSEGFVDVAGGRIHYEVSGDGPVVTLIHPGLWDMRTWDRQMTTFPASGFRTVRYDIRGYGQSSRPSGEPYSDLADLVAVLDALQVERTALVGCSVGGRLAIETTLEHPGRVWALVPIAPGVGGFERTPEEEAWWTEAWRPVEEAYDAEDWDRTQDLRLAIWASLGTDDDAGRRIRDIAFDNIHEMHMDESGAAELDPPAAGRLGEIAVPTLVVCPDHDPPPEMRAYDAIASRIRGARRVVIPGSDHVVNVRQPEAFDRTVLGFLTEFRPR